MKLAINTRYGGFNISQKGMLEIAKRKGLKVYPYVNDPNYSMREDRYMKRNLVHSEVPFIYYLLQDVGDKFEGNIYSDDLYWRFNPSEYENRTDSELIATIEHLGDDANGRYADIEVVEIPDGFDYKITDYDGVETVYYGQQLGVI